MKATVVWKEKIAFDGKSESGHTIPMDTAVDKGGDNSGPSPMELLLLSLGGCTAMDVVVFLKKRRVEPEGVEVEIEAERAKEHPQVFIKATILYKFKGEGIKESDVKWAVELSQNKYCSVTAMFSKTAKIDFRWKIN
ncbi:MAG: OsmC family protein [candidate division Zixibacteria bacterium]|nr:OsmC family protein [candidate division Zixibacteria bacterium]